MWGALGLSVVATTTAVRTEPASVRGVAAPEWVHHPSQPFAVGATETTVAQFRSCVAAAACDGSSVLATCNYGMEGFDDHPVNCVTHTGAEQFCAAIGGRLCTQAEWLSACRGVDDRPFPYGAAFDTKACNSNSQKDAIAGKAGTVPVGSLDTCEGGLPGLMDMAGNVNEWLADCKGTYCKFRGGGHISNEPLASFAACNSVCSGNQKTLQSVSVGFRCCTDTVSKR